MNFLQFYFEKQIKELPHFAAAILRAQCGAIWIKLTFVHHYIGPKKIAGTNNR